MKKFGLTSLLILASLASSAVLANLNPVPVQGTAPVQNQYPANYQGGFSGPASGGFNTAKAVANAGFFSDETPVVLTGYIISAMGAEMYLFRDSSGEVPIEIDNDDWYGLQVNPQTRVTIYGEIDVDFMGTKIDVDRIQRN